MPLEFVYVVAIIGTRENCSGQNVLRLIRFFCLNFVSPNDFFLKNI